MNSQTFTVHDVSDFPLVRFQREAVAPGYSAAWKTEMEALCAGPDFALVFPTAGLNEPHEDYKTRGLWLKQNHERLSLRCRLLVTVEADAEKRAALEKTLVKRGKAFGIEQACVASIAEAHALGHEALSRQALTNSGFRKREKK